MKCSNCKLEGYNKNNCPRCKEKEEERINRLLEILPFETAFIAISYVSLSQLIQKQGTVTDLLGSAGDLAALKHPNAGIALGGMLSLAYEGSAGELGLVNWLEEQLKAGKGLYETATDPKKSFGPYG
tara:strand:- start:153 stop:533 length:381 start_codon:yes stop_codon:yes gene_type:complete